MIKKQNSKAILSVSFCFNLLFYFLFHLTLKHSSNRYQITALSKVIKKKNLDNKFQIFFDQEISIKNISNAKGYEEIKMFMVIHSISYLPCTLHLYLKMYMWKSNNTTDLTICYNIMARIKQYLSIDKWRDWTKKVWLQNSKVKVLNITSIS